MAMTLNLVTYSDADLINSYIHKTAAGAPIDMTGYTLHLMVRKQANDPTAEFECTTQNGRIWWNDQVGGAFTLQIPLLILSVLAPGTYQQSLIAVQPVSLLRREMWRGTLEHAAGPTRWDLGTP